MHQLYREVGKKMKLFKMGKVVIRSLFTKPATKMYPIKPQEYYKITRGHIDIEIESCIFCGICSKKCPTHAIEVVKAEKTWAIERLKCIQCNCCVEVCPKKCLMMGNAYTPPSTTKEKEVFKDARVANDAANNKNS